MKQLVLATIMMLGFQFANAQEHVEFGPLAFGGTGCKGEEAAPVLNLRKRSLTISTLSLLGDSTNPSLILREACNVRVNVKIEKGFQLGVRVAEVSGSIDQSSGVTTTVTASASLIRQEAEQTLTQELAKKMKGSYRVSNKNAKDSFTWSTCSHNDIDSMLALSANAFAIRNQAGTKVKASVKTLKFELAVRACDSLN